MFKKNCVAVVVIFWLAIQTAENRKQIKISGLNCKSLDKSFCDFTLCRLKAVKRDVVEVSVYVSMLQLPVNNLSLNLAIRKRGFDESRALYEFTIDVCAFLRNKRRNPLAQLMYTLADLAKYSNANHSCPLNHDLIIDKYRFNDKYIPLIPVPPDYYIMSTYWYSSNILRARADINVNFYEE